MVTRYPCAHSSGPLKKVVRNYNTCMRAKMVTTEKELCNVVPTIRKRDVSFVLRYSALTHRNLQTNICCQFGHLTNNNK